jgi:putative peptidoglycan lipid II flippase
VSQHRGGTGTLNVYVYVQAIYLLPYAVLAVPFAMSALPALATGLDQAVLSAGPDQARLATTADQASLVRAQSTLASSARAIIVATSAGAAVLFAIARPTGAFFSALDAGRHGAGGVALAALPAALSAFAPGLMGFGMAALLSRALYVQGRPAVAGALVAAGWFIAALVPLLVLQADAGPRSTLLALGFASSFGMTVAAVGLLAAVRRAWGAQAFRGFGRSAVVGLAAGAFSAAVGRGLAAAMDPAGLLSGAAVATLVAVVVALVFAAGIWVGDRGSARLALARLPVVGRRSR